MVKLSQGLIGAENSYLLGTFFVTKMYQAAMARQSKGKGSRSAYYLYIDEFQNFITPSMSSILSGARKYGLGLVLAHQDMAQLTKYDNELASSVVSNAGTRVCFRLGDTDAKRFEAGFSYFDRADLENLHTGEAICRVERPEFDFSLDTIPLKEFATSLGETVASEVVKRSRAKYGTPRAEVEKSLEILRDGTATKIDKAEKATAAPVAPKKEPGTPKPIPIEAQEETIEKIIKQKEQSRHRYLQNLIKKMAESRGYAAGIEETTPDGKGRVDVSLQRNGKRIAVEVCSTTGTDWEIHNIEKCLSAGYDLVVECTEEQKTLEAVKKKLTGILDQSQLAKILVAGPEEFFTYLDQENAKEATKEVRTKGYRVKVEYSAVSAADAKHINDAIVKTVTEVAKKKVE